MARLTPEMERVGKIIVEAEGGCWHEWQQTYNRPNGQCTKCNEDWGDSYTEYPDFSQWPNFGRLLKLARLHIDNPDFYLAGLIAVQVVKSDFDIDQIPTLVATELARILEKKGG